MLDPIADFRSDTVTRPCAGMRDAMANAVVGDDVYGEDPTVNELEQRVSELAGMEAGLFTSTATQSNLLALLSHCQRGDEYIVGQQAHSYRYEGGGAAALGGIQPQPLDFLPDGTLDLGAVESAIKPDDPHFAVSRLLCLENTHNGQALSLEYQERAQQLCEKRGLALHLDGARLFNSHINLEVQLIDITDKYNSVTLCFSKGLGAPAGSMLCGSRDFIRAARRWRKVVGGGMRQVGILAAACDYALNNNVQRLTDDERRAEALATGLADLPYLTCEAQHTNMVFVRFENHSMAAKWRQHLREHGILVSGDEQIRLVTHLDIDDAAIDAILAAAISFESSAH